MAFDTSQFREFRYGWPVVLASTFGISLGMSPLPFYTIGVFAQPLAEEFGWGIDQIMLGLVPFCVVTVISAPMAGYLSDRYGVGKVALISMLTFAMGMMLFLLNQRLAHALPVPLGAAVSPQCRHPAHHLHQGHLALVPRKARSGVRDCIGGHRHWRCRRQANRRGVD